MSKTLAEHLSYQLPGDHSDHAHGPAGCLTGIYQDTQTWEEYFALVCPPVEIEAVDTPPVPIPSAALLLGSALVGLVVVKRVRR